jgi:hypothetical protein
MFRCAEQSSVFNTSHGAMCQSKANIYTGPKATVSDPSDGLESLGMGLAVRSNTSLVGSAG